MRRRFNLSQVVIFLANKTIFPDVAVNFDVNFPVGSQLLSSETTPALRTIAVSKNKLFRRSLHPIIPREPQSGAVISILGTSGGRENSTVPSAEVSPCARIVEWNAPRSSCSS